MAGSIEATPLGLWRSAFGEWIQGPGIAERLKTASLARDLRS